MFPRLHDALDLLFGHPHHTGPHAAAILRVDLAKLHAALAPLEAVGLVEVAERDSVHETWRLRLKADASVADLVEAIERKIESGDLPKRVLETSLE